MKQDQHGTTSSLSFRSRIVEHKEPQRLITCVTFPRSRRFSCSLACAFWSTIPGRKERLLVVLINPCSLQSSCFEKLVPRSTILCKPVPTGRTNTKSQRSRLVFHNVARETISKFRNLSIISSVDITLYFLSIVFPS